jgi:hypothetical protein
MSNSMSQVMWRRHNMWRRHLVAGPAGVTRVRGTAVTPRLLMRGPLLESLTAWTMQGVHCRSVRTVVIRVAMNLLFRSGITAPPIRRYRSREYTTSQV